LLQVGVETAEGFDLFRGSRDLAAFGHEESLFLFPDQNGEGPVQQQAGSAGFAEVAARKAFHQGQEAVPLQYIVRGDLKSRQKLETGLNQTGSCYIL
jgi:hypothetical protein